MKTTSNDARNGRARNAPDIRMRSNGAAETRALMYLTPEGEAFVRAFAARTRGFWREAENTYFFHESLLPVDDLERSGLSLVAGIGTTPEHDVPWLDDDAARQGYGAG